MPGRGRLAGRFFHRSCRSSQAAHAVVADDTFDDGITLARAIALDPPVQSLDAAQLGSRLRAFRAVYPRIQTIVVAGMNGTVLGWSADERLPDPAPSIVDRPFLARVTQTGQPTTIRVVNTEGPLAFSTGVAAPISTADGATVGVVAVILKLESIGSRLTEIRLFPGQVLTLIDPNGRVALFVGINGVTSVEVPWEQRDRSALPEVQAALGGEEVTSATYRGVRTGQERL